MKNFLVKLAFAVMLLVIFKVAFFGFDKAISNIPIKSECNHLSEWVQRPIADSKNNYTARQGLIADNVTALVECLGIERVINVDSYPDRQLMYNLFADSIQVFQVDPLLDTQQIRSYLKEGNTLIIGDWEKTELVTAAYLMMVEGVTKRNLHDEFDFSFTKEDKELQKLYNLLNLSYK